MSHAFGPTDSPPNRDAIDLRPLRNDACSPCLHPDGGGLEMGALGKGGPPDDPSVDLGSGERPAVRAPCSTVVSLAKLADRAVAAHRPADDLPPLDDPFLTSLPAAKRQQLSTLALSSVIAAVLLGPIGAVAAIGLGLAARREIGQAPARRRGKGLATVGLALGALLTFAWGAVFGLGLWMWKHHQGEEVAAAHHESDPSPEPASTASPAAPVQSPPATSEPPGGSAPQHTVSRRVGAVSIVDIGVDAPTLGEELARQRAEAHGRGEKILVMTTSAPCEPCRGVDRSLSDPQMQTALRGVRLVRVDIDVFKEELDQLKMPRRLYPGFFLLAPDLTPQDGINGGEWDDDIARNIAPVLGAFVRGQYKARRQPWQPLPGSGMQL